jgi:predicted DNA-binding antitoxin AbrB/MazE fold protein
MTMAIVKAIFVNGVFRPIQPVDLPEGCTVEFEPRFVSLNKERASLDEIYEILCRRCDSGEWDVAARHDEHQP